MSSRNSSDQEIRNQAADWLARSDNELGADEQLEFERWISVAEHRAVYDSMKSSYAEAEMLQKSMHRRDWALERAFPKRPTSWLRPARAASIAVLVAVGSLYLLGGQSISPFGSRVEAAMLTSGATPLAIELKDGTRVRLEPSSAMEIELGRNLRRARLQRGRAHIIIAHDERPFILSAGTAEKRVLEGGFDLELTLDRGTIREGSLAAVAQVTGNQSELSHQRETFSQTDFRTDFDATPLSLVASQANKWPKGSIIEVDPQVSDLPVTGTFHVMDRNALAGSLALTFDLVVTYPQVGVVRLEPKKK